MDKDAYRANGPDTKDGYGIHLTQSGTSFNPTVLCTITTPDDTFSFNIKTTEEMATFRMALRSALGRALNEERKLATAISNSSSPSTPKPFIWVYGDIYSGDHVLCAGLKELGVTPVSGPPRWSDPAWDKLRDDPKEWGPRALALVSDARRKYPGEWLFVRGDPLPGMNDTRFVAPEWDFRFIYVHRSYEERVFEAQTRAGTPDYRPVPQETSESRWAYYTEVYPERFLRIDFRQLQTDPGGVLRTIADMVELQPTTDDTDRAVHAIEVSKDQQMPPRVHLDQ